MSYHRCRLPLNVKIVILCIEGDLLILTNCRRGHNTYDVPCKDYTTWTLNLILTLTLTPSPSPFISFKNQVGLNSQKTNEQDNQAHNMLSQLPAVKDRKVKQQNYI